MTNNLCIPQYNKDGNIIRTSRSFICRNRSLSRQSINLIKTYWKDIGIDFKKKKIDCSSMFDNVDNPIILEVGFGDGSSLINSALMYKNYNILGVEVYIPSIPKIIHKLFLEGKCINNIKVILHDVVEVLQYMICNNSIHIIQFFFPDPWVKLRHHKRRILNISVINLVCTKLVPGGILHIITDCKSYYHSIVDITNGIQNLKNISEFYCLSYYSGFLSTRFAQKALLKNNKIYNLIFICVK
ncbi:tRNA (guanine-N(7)-)-methyltransferase [Buchnera aphidicola (Pterocallis alni)]